jgi:hypothetical protein
MMRLATFINSDLLQRKKFVKFLNSMAKSSLKKIEKLHPVTQKVRYRFSFFHLKKIHLTSLSLYDQCRI